MSMIRQTRIQRLFLKLPKLSLQTFNGELSSWIPFWDSLALSQLCIGTTSYLTLINLAIYMHGQL